MFINEKIRNSITTTTDNALAMSPDELYKLIMDAVTPVMPYLARGGEQPMEIIPQLDYGIPARDWKRVGDIPAIDNWVRIKTDTCPGGSEGVYTDVSIVTLGDDYITTPLFTFKTLNEGPDAYVAMGALGGMVSYAAELFLMNV
ncbi:MAG: hypothetical protein IJX83_13955 [Lachnospiraceae bacterium]|nr:hypothetical protein [Lachnospiraceae bacterium]